MPPTRTRSMRFATLASVSLLLGCTPHNPASAPSPVSADAAGEWTAYGKDVLGSRHSGLTQIDTGTVARLQVAWTYHTGELAPTVQTRRPRSLEATPIVVDGVMYLITPIGRIIALDPETGKEKWVYDARLDRTIGFGDHTSRGVSTWLDPSRAAGQPCRRRIVAATGDARLLSIDAATGTLCEDFGTKGTVEAPYNKGRSATHEVGHYFNLRHIWGDTPDCSGSDLVADTPNSAGPNFGKPKYPHVTCNNGPNGDMFMNYMDYTDDDAMVMFTTQQIARIRATLNGPRRGLW